MPSNENVSLAYGIPAMGRILDDSSKEEQVNAPRFSTDRINQLYGNAITNGVLAGKVSGASGGGFVAFLVHPKDCLGLLCARNAVGGSAESAKFADRGCEP